MRVCIALFGEWGGVEAILKQFMELMDQRFDQMDDRFEQIDKRFDRGSSQLSN